jgi:transposase InsO family protein
MLIMEENTYNRLVAVQGLGSITHAQQTATQWLWLYNNERPNMAIGGITPKQKLAQAA